MRSSARVTRPLTAGTLVVLALALSACSKKKDEEPPAIPSATATAAPAPTPTPAPVEVAPEPAQPIQDAGPDAKKTVGHAASADVAGLRACCAALKQNAASMPSPNKEYATSAAQVCDGLVGAMASGSTSKAGALGLIGATLRGANLPPACR